MKLGIIFTLLTVSVAVAQTSLIKTYEYILKLDGSYSHSFETDDGTKVEAIGQQKQFTTEDTGTVARGSFSYTTDGQQFDVEWVADENGFQPKGDHLPVPPPTPPHVVELLEFLRQTGQL